MINKKGAIPLLAVIIVIALIVGGVSYLVIKNITKTTGAAITGDAISNDEAITDTSTTNLGQNITPITLCKTGFTYINGKCVGNGGGSQAQSPPIVSGFGGGY